MSKKSRFLVALSLIFTIFVCNIPCVFAADVPNDNVAVPLYESIDAVSASLFDNEDDTADFTVRCIGTTDVTKIEIDVTLQQKGLLGIYSKADVDPVSKTINKNSGTFLGSFDIDSSKTYRIKVDITVYTATSEESHTTYSDPT